MRNLFLITEISDLGVPCLYLGQERHDMFVHKRFEEAAFKLDALGGAGVTVEATNFELWFGRAKALIFCQCAIECALRFVIFRLEQPLIWDDLEGNPSILAVAIGPVSWVNRRVAALPTDFAKACAVPTIASSFRL